MLVDELPDEDPGDSEHRAGDKERPADPDRLGDQTTQHRAGRDPHVHTGLQQPHAPGEALPRDDARHQRGGRRDRPGEHALENSQHEELLDVLHQPHERDDQSADQHRPKHHQLAPVPVGERAPDRAEDRERDPGAGDERPRPEDDRAVGMDADLFQVERQKGQHEAEGEHGGRLCDADDGEAGPPAWAHVGRDVARRGRPRPKSQPAPLA